MDTQLINYIKEQKDKAKLIAKTLIQAGEYLITKKKSPLKAILTVMNKRILLVEDNPTTQKLLAIILEKMGLEMTIVNNGLDAIELTKKQSFAMILMDYQLPAMDGVSVAKQLRNMGVEIPIIALTAYFQDDIREQCLLSGMNDVLNKPFRQSEIATMLRNGLA